MNRMPAGHRSLAFQNGLGFYNALRYNGKKAVLLAYPGEGHGLRGMANCRDGRSVVPYLKKTVDVEQLAR